MRRIAQILGVATLAITLAAGAFAGPTESFGVTLGQVQIDPEKQAIADREAPARPIVPRLVVSCEDELDPTNMACFQGNGPYDFPWRGYSNPNNYRYFKICCDAGQRMNIRVNRMNTCMDPIAWACRGDLCDENVNITGLYSCGSAQFLGGADDSGRWCGIGGNYYDPNFYVTCPSEGFVLLVVSDFLGACSTPRGEIHVTNNKECVSGPSDPIEAIEAKLDRLAPDVDALEAKADLLEAKVDGLEEDFLQISREIATFRYENWQLEAELGLLNIDRISYEYLPASCGGRLEDIRDLVRGVIDSNVACGISVGNAEDHFASGEAAYAQGDWKGAFDGYRQAYRDVVTGN
jgi:outer membrane murein-binding lipoprotein Lpp